MTRPLVSVIIPAYHAAKYIGETLDTVGSQSYKSWEVIVIEDASDDGTEQVVSDFAAKFPHHRVVFERNANNVGQGASRNRAIALSQGNFIALLDADDLWDPEHLATTLAAFDSSQCDLCFSTTTAFDNETGETLYEWGPTAEEVARFPDSLFARCYITPSTVVMRKRVLEHVGPFSSDRSIQGSEDVDFWLRSVEAGIKFHHIDRNCVRYRKGHAEAATTYMENIFVKHVTVLSRHRHLTAFSHAAKRSALIEYFLFSAKYNEVNRPRLAARMFWHAWRLDWTQWKYLQDAARLLCSSFVPRKQMHPTNGNANQVLQSTGQ